MVTAFGKELRKIRLDNNELLKDMADNLEITPAYLSAIENGKKKPTAFLVEKVIEEYSLLDDTVNHLMESYYRTIEEISLNAIGMTSQQFDMGLVLARKLNELESEQIEDILRILNK